MRDPQHPHPGQDRRQQLGHHKDAAADREEQDDLGAAAKGAAEHAGQEDGVGKKTPDLGEAPTRNGTRG